MTQDPNTKITMLNPSGDVRNIPLYMRDELLKQGWKIILNPKEEYYPMYDTTLKNYYKDGSDEINVDSNNFLEVKII